MTTAVTTTTNTIIATDTDITIAGILTMMIRETGGIKVVITTQTHGTEDTTTVTMAATTITTDIHGVHPTITEITAITTTGITKTTRLVVGTTLTDTTYAMTDVTTTITTTTVTDTCTTTTIIGTTTGIQRQGTVMITGMIHARNTMTTI